MSFSSHRINESLNLSEKFVDAEGKNMDQQSIVKRVHDAMIWSKGDFNKFKETMSSKKEIKGPGITQWKVDYEDVPITDEKTLKNLFDNYRPVSMLNEKAFVWMINQIYSVLVNNKYVGEEIFNTKVINNLGVNVHLRDKDLDIHVAELQNGKSCIIDSGPFTYRYNKGYYYNSAEDVKDLAVGRNKPIDLEIVIRPHMWTLEAKTSKGTKVMEKLLNNRKAFDTYSGWYEGDKFCFILYKFKAPQAQIKAKEGDREKEAA